MTKARSLVWIFLAYLLCTGAALAYLLYGPLTSSLLFNTFIADVIATLVIFAFSRCFKNSSFYDAYWSVIPPLIMLYWYIEAGHLANNERTVLLAIVMVYWAVRLTWNWIKHWPGMVHEDWRYPMLRNKAPEYELPIDFFAIHIFPTIQVFLGLLPVYAVIVLSDRPLNVLDYIAFIVGIVAVTLELVSDIQLHRFLAQKKPGEIINTGLWSCSRHPNYLGELLFWLSLVLFGIAALPGEWWWQILGVLAMLAMFLFASIPMMEERSLERRPQYQQVIETVPVLFPWWPKNK